MGKYRRKKNAKLPFIKPGSGSNTASGSYWGRLELEWLGVDVEKDCDFQEILDSDCALGHAGKAAQYLRGSLSHDWKKIMEPDDSMRKDGFYSSLRELAMVREPNEPYQKSDQPDIPPLIEFSSEMGTRPQSTKSSHEEEQGSSDEEYGFLEAEPSTPPSLPVLLKEPARPRSRQFLEYDSSLLPTKPLSLKGPPVEVSSQPSSQTSSEPDWDTSNTQSSSPTRNPNPNSAAPHYRRVSQPSQPRAKPRPEQDSSSIVHDLPLSILPSSNSNSDPTYSDPALPVKSKAERQEDKDEKDVEETVRMYMRVVGHSLRAAEPELKVGVRAANGLPIKLDDSNLSAKPDVCLWVAPTDAEGQKTVIKIYTECKRLGHGKNKEEILGQEVAELIAATLEQSHNGHPLDDYIKYLISWHHLKCYISRVDISKKYLSLLASDSKLVQETPLKIKRSRVLKMKEPEDRISLGMAVATLVIQELSHYVRYQHHQGSSTPSFNWTRPAA